ncbi:MAG TPA: amidohydrolase [Steroidobacteraceae bacterium]|nr:amidohydrolase [Steroidobacteraceae bacterium]
MGTRRSKTGTAFVAALTLTLVAGVAAAQGAPPADAAAARPSSPVKPARETAAKRAAVNAVDRHAAELTGLSDRIWAYAETALREHKSAAALADYAEQQGFKVERGVAGMPTAFVATYGSGRPVIGVMGEYDALPGISQKASPVKEALETGAGGHGCGHNLFGAASLGAALAIKEQIAAGKLDGTIRFYGTPAEENYGGKIYMAREGLFDGVDVVLAWHPSDETQADMVSSQAMVDLMVEFQGKAAHAAGDPWNGRSALDAAELFTHGINQMREHVKPTSRMHYTIPAAGDVPNVVPEHAKVWLWLRDWERDEVEGLLARTRKLAEGAATMTGTAATVHVQGGSWNMLVNETGERLLHSNLLWLGPIVYTEAEQAFARQIQQATGVPEAGMFGGIKPLEGQVAEGGSTDVADVSWIAPTLHVSVATSPKDAPWHAWPVVATGGMSIGHKGLVQASKVLAATMVDLYEQPRTLAAIQAEFKAKKGDTAYKAYVPDGPPPVPEG